jgi:Ca2+-binding EF-hand superfamily protein
MKMAGTAMCLTAAMVAASVAQAQSSPNAQQAGAQGQQAATPDSIFNRWDKDKNKVLSLEEFKGGWQEIQTNNALRKLHTNFVAMDLNKNGTLEPLEYSNLELIKKAGKSAPPMSNFDTDKNQKLDFKEYVGMINTMVAKKQ